MTPLYKYKNKHNIMKIFPFLATALFILLISSTAKADSFNDTFDTAANWSNSSLFGSTPANFEINPAGVMRVYPAGRIHTINSSLNVAKPYVFSVYAKYDTAGASEIKLTDSTGNRWVYISLNWAGNSITIISDETYCKGTFTGLPYSFSFGQWYNVTLISGQPAELLVNGNHIAYLDMGGCSPSTYVFLGASGTSGDSRFDNLYWYTITVSGYNIWDVGVFSAIEYDEHGCNKQLSGASISVYNGLTGELLGTKTPTDITEPNCCSVLNISYSCTLARFFVPKSWSYVYAVVSAPNYETETSNTTLPYPHMGSNFFILPTYIYRYDGKIIDYNSLEPIQNAQVCVYYSNDTLASQCIFTSNVGEFSFYLYKNTNYYLSITADGHECAITGNFNYDKSISSVYYLKKDVNPWGITLTSNATSGIGNTSIKFRSHICRSSNINVVNFQYIVSSYSYLEMLPDASVTNPYFFIRNLTYCGENDVWLSAIDRNGTLKESNHIKITISEPCLTAPTFGQEPYMNTTPYANVSAQLPPEVEWVNYFLTPPIFISIFVFGIAGLVASKIGGEKKGIIFLASSLIIFFVLSFTGVLPKWMLIIIGIGGGMLIFMGLRHKEEK
jgi:hypothetical protein